MIFKNYLKRTILVVTYEGLNGEPIKKMAKKTVSNDSNIDVLTGSLTNLVMANSMNEKANNNIKIDTQLQ